MGSEKGCCLRKQPLGIRDQWLASGAWRQRVKPRALMQDGEEGSREHLGAPEYQIQDP